MKRLIIQNVFFTMPRVARYSRLLDACLLFWLYQIFFCSGFNLSAQEQTETIKGPKRKASIEEYSRMLNLWLTLTDKNIKEKETVKKKLLEGHETALEVILDFYFGDSDSAIQKQIDKLGSELGSETFVVREAAQKKLISMGLIIIPFIKNRKRERDPEVIIRLKEINSAIDKNKVNPLYSSYGTEFVAYLLVNDWSIKEIRDVARLNLDRFADIEELPVPDCDRILATFLTTLRFSKDKSDHQLLRDFLKLAKGSAAVVALKIIDHGMAAFEVNAPFSPWRSLPAMDFTQERILALDPKHPKVFAAAMEYAPEPEKITPRIYEIIQSKSNDPFSEKIYDYLWKTLYDPVARKHYLEILETMESPYFDQALDNLTAEEYQEKAGNIITVLKRTLNSENKSRRKKVLEKLANYFNKEYAQDAALAVAPFLLSAIKQEKEMAERVLIILNARSSMEIVSGLAETHPNPEIRTIAKKLLNQMPQKSDFVGKWRSSQIREKHVYELKEDGTCEVSYPGTSRLSDSGGWEFYGDSIYWKHAQFIFRIQRGKPVKYPKDINPILEHNKDSFKVRELDGSITTFTRIKEERKEIGK